MWWVGAAVADEAVVIVVVVAMVVLAVAAGAKHPRSPVAILRKGGHWAISWRGHSTPRISHTSKVPMGT